MDEIERLWEGRLLAPVTEATVGELLGLCDLHRCDVWPDVGHEPDRPYLRPGEIAALELFADRGTVRAGKLFAALGGRDEPYAQLRSLLRDFHYAVTWPEDPDSDLPLGIEGRMLPGVPQTLWDEVREWRHRRASCVVDIVGTVIEVIPLDASPEVVPLIAEFAGVPTKASDERRARLAGFPGKKYPSYVEPLTGDWAEWVEVNRALCAAVHADLV